MNKYKLAVIGLLCAAQAFAQNEEDILRYSQQYPLGTARSQGIGGAIGSIGADFSSTFINPAGLGLYRRGEYHLSAAITSNNASSTFLGNTQTDNRTGFNIPSFGIVLTKVNTGLGGDATKGIVSYSFSFGLNRSNDFQQNVFMQGFNNQSNLTDYYIERSNGLTPSQIMDNPMSIANMGYQVYMTDTAGNNTSYYSPWLYNVNSYRFLQSYTVTRRGSMREYNFNAGMNIADVVYLGAGLVMSSVRNDLAARFRESDPNRTAVQDSFGATYNYSELNTFVNTEGSGVAGRFGIIVRPLDVLRIGFAAQTSMRMNMRDYYRYESASSFNFSGFGYNEYRPEQAFFEYQVVTPARYTASASVMLPSLGFLSADLEMVDYSKGELKSQDYIFSAENDAASRLYGQAYALRLGSEVKIADHYRLRAGYSLNTSPYKTTPPGINSSDLLRNAYSVGAGYTDGEFFIDFAAVATRYTEFNTPYVMQNGFTPTGISKHTMLNFVLTSGYRF